MESAKLYDRQPGETDKSFMAFSFYRDMGLNRTIDGAYGLYAAERGLKHRDKAIDHFTDWARENRWRERALAYDRDMAETERRMKEALLGDQYEGQVRKLQEDQLKIGWIGLEASLEAMKELSAYLKRRESQGQVIESLRDAEILVRIFKTLHETSTEQIAAALGLGQLLEEIDKRKGR